MKSKEIIYYSVNSFLAYWINENFYNNHFIWCSPIFDPSVLNEYDKYKKIPPSSAPAKIYRTFQEDVNGDDLHSAKIRDNRLGLKRGAIINYENGIISETELAIINSIIEKANITKFRPLLYIMPFNKIKEKLTRVEVDISANPLSMEYQINGLTNQDFDIIEFNN